MNAKNVITNWYKKIGRKGGLSRSPEKLRAARLNGKKGGRPRLQETTPKDATIPPQSILK